MATRAILTPGAAEFPSTNFPQLATVHSTERRYVLWFDAATDEAACWTVVAPQGLTGAQSLVMHCIAASATSGNTIFQASVEAITPTDAVDLDAATSFDTANASSATAVAGTAGYDFSVSVTLTNADSMAAGDLVRFKVNRDADNVGDTAAGDIGILAIEWRDAA